MKVIEFLLVIGIATNYPFLFQRLKRNLENLIFPTKPRKTKSAYLQKRVRIRVEPRVYLDKKARPGKLFFGQFSEMSFFNYPKPQLQINNVFQFI